MAACPSHRVLLGGKTRAGEALARQPDIEEECMRRFTTAALALTIAATGIMTGALAVAAQDGSISRSAS